MCFSAAASFAASGTTAIAGTAALTKAKPLPLKLYAAIPFLFAFQQAIEGVQWLIIRDGTPGHFLGYAYLFFAFLLWPTYTPVVAYLLETNRKRRQLLSILVFVGACISVLLFFVLLTRPLTIEMLNHSIAYRVDIPYEGLVLALYALATCGSTIASSRKGLRLFGITLAAGLAISLLVYFWTFASVWCFFAAMLSLIIVVDVYSEQTYKRLRPAGKMTK